MGSSEEGDFLLLPGADKLDSVARRVLYGVRSVPFPFNVWGSYGAAFETTGLEVSQS